MNDDTLYVAEPHRNIGDWVHTQLDRVSSRIDRLIDNDWGPWGDDVDDALICAEQTRLGDDFGRREREVGR